MRYVIACLLSDEALNFHENLTNDICNRYEVKRQRLPGHFTLKAPFETDNIDELLHILKEFSSQNSKAPIELKNYGHFREDVVYMSVYPSKAAVQIYNDLIDTLKNIKWLEWKRNEGRGKIFHCTLISKIPKGKFQGIWDYSNQFIFHFNAFFDNITVLRWEKDKWVIYKEFKL